MKNTTDSTNQSENFSDLKWNRKRFICIAGDRENEATMKHQLNQLKQ